MTQHKNISLNINGKEYSAKVEPRMLLSDLLRDEFNLTGTHVGCEHGICGACTIMMDGRAVRSCLIFGVQADQTEIMTVEGLSLNGDSLHPLQKAISEKHGLQCGFCTPGVLVSAYQLLKENPDPTRAEIREGISGNLCRCTGYQGIVEAVECALKELNEGKGEQTFTQVAVAKEGR